MLTSGNFTRRLLSCSQVGGIDKSSKTCRDTFSSVKRTCRRRFPSHVAVFLPSFLRHLRESSPPVWFVPFPDSLNWLPVASSLSSASPELSRCLLSPTAALSSVTSALLCHLLHLPDVLSSLLHLPGTPTSTWFFSFFTPPNSNWKAFLGGCRGTQAHY